MSLSATPLASHSKGNSYFWPLPMCWIEDKIGPLGSGDRRDPFCRMLAKEWCFMWTRLPAEAALRSNTDVAVVIGSKIRFVGKRDLHGSIP